MNLKKVFKISTAKDFLNISNNPSAHYILVNDIDFKNVPILAKVNFCFSGIFDGNNHRIVNPLIRNDKLISAGLFGNLGFKAIIKNLKIKNAFVVAQGYVGVIAGENYGAIVNCNVDNSIVEGYYNVGGITGVNHKKAKIVNCETNTIIISNVNIGGIAGNNMILGQIIGCRSSGKFCGLENVGGIAGQSYGVLAFCNSTADLKGEVYGQLAGLNRGKIIFNHSKCNKIIRQYYDKILICSELVGRNLAIL